MCGRGRGRGKRLSEIDPGEDTSEVVVRDGAGLSEADMRRLLQEDSDSEDENILVRGFGIRTIVMIVIVRICLTLMILG